MYKRSERNLKKITAGFILIKLGINYWDHLFILGIKPILFVLILVLEIKINFLGITFSVNFRIIRKSNRVSSLTLKW